MIWRDFRGGTRRDTPRISGRSRGPVGWAIAVLCSAAWWWAGLRLLAQPDRAGPVEGLVIAGGWGLSLLPVHCVPWTRRAKRPWIWRVLADRAWRRREEP
ncbi:hypothetical protein [Streptomyces sp. NPDC002537]